MLDLTNPNLKLSDFEVSEYVPREPKGKKIFIPFFKVKGKKVEYTKYESIKLPDEINELLQKEI